jgi:hypothetical protein
MIQTERLTLRIPRAKDFDGFAEFQADEDASRYVGAARPA